MKAQVVVTRTADMDMRRDYVALPKDYGTIKFKVTVTDVDPVYDNEYTGVYSNMTEDDRQALLYYMYLYS